MPHWQSHTKVMAEIGRKRQGEGHAKQDKNCKASGADEQSQTLREPKLGEAPVHPTARTEMARKRQGEEHAEQENKRKALRTMGVQPCPTKREVTQPAAKRFDYVCPFCNVAVSSNVRSGQVDQRRGCGKQFQVKDGQVAAKKFVYRCPFRDGTVASNVTSGQIDHHGTCGNRFEVQNGLLSNRTQRHARKCPLCRTTVW